MKSPATKSGSSRDSSRNRYALGKRLVIIWVALMAVPLVGSETPQDPKLEERGRAGSGANSPQGGFLYVVNTTSDSVVAGACESGGASCSLRGAIQAANSHPGFDGIDISLPAGSVINLTQALPFLSESVDINGSGADRITVRRNTGIRVVSAGSASRALPRLRRSSRRAVG